MSAFKLYIDGAYREMDAETFARQLVYDDLRPATDADEKAVRSIIRAIKAALSRRRGELAVRAAE